MTPVAGTIPSRTPGLSSPGRVLLWMDLEPLRFGREASWWCGVAISAGKLTIRGGGRVLPWVMTETGLMRGRGGGATVNQLSILVPGGDTMEMTITSTAQAKQAFVVGEP